MRYKLTDRIAHPRPEDGHLWWALDQINVRYEKFGSIKSNPDLRRNQWRAPAKIWFDSSKWGAVLYKERYYITGKGKNCTQGMNSNSLQVEKDMRAYMRAGGIPFTEVRRTWTSDEMKVFLQNWVTKVKKGE